MWPVIKEVSEAQEVTDLAKVTQLGSSEASIQTSAVGLKCPSFDTLLYMYGWNSLVVQRVKNLSAMQERPRFDPWGQEDTLEKGMATHSSILAWRIPWKEFHVTESDTTEQLTHTHTHKHTYVC